MEKPTIFILGCERSGSTWLLNILDSSPFTISYMEPFADYAGIFPGFPQRFTYLSDVNEAQTAWVKQKFDTLYGIKYGFFHKPGYWPSIKKLDRAYVNVIKKVNQVAGLGLSKKIEQYELLNLTEIDFRKRAKKEINQIIIKELRLNFKTSLIKPLFPDSRIVVAIRNPVLQIDSILKNFRKNGLGELKRSLLFFENELINTPRFKSYSSHIKGFSGRDIVEQLAIYWLIIYNTLVEDLDKLMLAYIIANNDAISVDPEVEIKKILEFCEIDIDNQILEYLTKSTTVVTNINNSIDTNRRSKEYYLRRVKELDTSLIDRIQAIINGELLSDKLRPILEFCA
jgi:hypothetical protein